jgi:uncharacterized protein
MGFLGLLRIYWFAALATLIIWILVGWELGLAAFITVVILTLLEMTFSADNAVINSKVLVTLSPFWQRLFMTVGIFIAVFLIRFALPILIVMITATLSAKDALDLALNHPHEYETNLKEAEPLINAFGGTFLLMTALHYFIDVEKDIHWFQALEKRLKLLDKIYFITPYLALLVTGVMYFTVDAEHRNTVLIAAASAIGLHMFLSWINEIMTKKRKASKNAHKVGMAALAAFLYLEVLDASFSLDGVIGAFAITSNVIIIMAGLGAGAVWIRAMTIHLTRAKVLAKYIFLEHGAHWAIAFLSSIMILKLYHVEPPEWIIGLLGIAFISLSIWRSIVHNRNHHTPKLHF